jgi:uncharacterized protein YbbC (DUF1343 family)
MEVAAKLNIEIILLDRPNILGGTILEGKVLDEYLAGSFIAYHTVPTRHGMTLGELAKMINAEKKINVNLQIIPVSGWKRENLLAQTDRIWICPSPSLMELKQAGLYALWGTMENFNLSVGRGQKNELAFKVIGAPWITQEESKLLADELNALNFPGIYFSPISWNVTRAIYNGERAQGVQLEWNGEEVPTDEFTYKISSLLLKLFRSRLNIEKMSPLFYGSESMIDAMKSQVSWNDYSSVIKDELRIFRERRKKFLLY